MKRYSITFIFALLTGILFAQSFTASVNRNPVPAGEQFVLTYTLNTGGSGFQGPPMPDFSIRGGPNQSTSMQIVNGSVSQSLSYSYYLIGVKEGRFTIPPASIEAGGKRIHSNSITIEVTKGQSQQSQGNSNQGNSSSDPLAGQLFLKAVVNKSNPVLGESMLLTYKLYTRVSLVNYSIPRPSYTGFWYQDVDLPNTLNRREETVNGVLFNVFDLKQIVVIPQRSGSLTIESMEAECIVRIQVNTNSFFGRHQDVKHIIKSAPISINVASLKGTAPEGYGGAVGNFSMEAFIDKPETKTNEAITLKIKINGTGNLLLIDPPAPVLPPDFESYEPKTSDNINVSSSGISGSRTFEYLLVPRHAGEYKIPSFDFSYYDLAKKSFKSIPSKEFLIKVTQGSETSASTPTGVSKEDLQFLGKDIRFIKTNNPEWNNESRKFFGSVAFYVLCLLPWVLFSACLLLLKRNKELKNNLVLLKSRQATTVARKRLVVAKKHLIANDKMKFYEEIYKALWGYISDRLQIPVSKLGRDSVKEAMLARAVSEEQVVKFIAALDKCEYSRFAPDAESEMKGMYDDTIKLITEIESNLK